MAQRKKNHAIASGSKATDSASIRGAGKKENRLGVELVLAPGISMHVNTGNCQNQGARSYQEDSFGYTNIIDSKVVSSKGLFAILSDGMGGLSNGRAVADFVVQKAIALFEKMDPHLPIQPQLTGIVRFINRQIAEKYVSEGSSSAGATVVLAYIFKNRIYWATAGDSRIYCMRCGRLFRLNEDHDYKNKLYRRYIDGEYDLSGVESEPEKDSLVSFIGKEDIELIDSSVRGCIIKPDDIFVLCSDGIYNAISEEGMIEILSAYDAQKASEKIVQNVLASRFPGQDNMTVMVIKCSKGGK